MSYKQNEASGSFYDVTWPITTQGNKIILIWPCGWTICYARIIFCWRHSLARNSVHIGIKLLFNCGSVLIWRFTPFSAWNFFVWFCFAWVFFCTFSFHLRSFPPTSSPLSSSWSVLYLGSKKAKLNPLLARWPMEPALISGFCSVFKRIRVFDSPWMGH